MYSAKVSNFPHWSGFTESSSFLVCTKSLVRFDRLIHTPPHTYTHMYNVYVYRPRNPYMAREFATDRFPVVHYRGSGTMLHRSSASGQAPETWNMGYIPACCSLLCLLVCMYSIFPYVVDMVLVEAFALASIYSLVVSHWLSCCSMPTLCEVLIVYLISSDGHTSTIDHTSRALPLCSECRSIQVLIFRRRTLSLRINSKRRVIILPTE